MYFLYVLCNEANPSLSLLEVCQFLYKLKIENGNDRKKPRATWIASHQILSQSDRGSLLTILLWSLHYVKRHLKPPVEARSIQLTTGGGKEPGLENISSKTIRQGNISIEISRKRVGLGHTGYQTWRMSSRGRSLPLLFEVNNRNLVLSRLVVFNALVLVILPYFFLEFLILEAFFAFSGQL
jgi:hypothetical protein